MRTKRSKEEWKRLITERKTSGKTVVQFCKEKGIHPTLFYKKQRELREANTFVKLNPTTRPKSTIRIRIKNIVIETENGITRNHLSEVLKSILEVIDAPIC